MSDIKPLLLWSTNLYTLMTGRRSTSSKADRQVILSKAYDKARSTLVVHFYEHFIKQFDGQRASVAFPIM